MPYETILVTRENHITTVTLNRPDKLNALNMQMAEELHDALAIEDQTDDTRVIVITGQGRGFSSGADLTPATTATTEGAPQPPRPSNAPSLADATFAALQIEKPIIASINGVAVGGGLTLTLSCDIRIASENARFQLPFTKLSISAELGSTYLLPRLVGWGKAMELILTSRMIDAAEAGAIGLVNHVVPADELADKTAEFAAILAALPPMAVRLNKKGVRLGMGSELEAQRRYEELAAATLRQTDDAKEARLAFQQKRDAVFTGR
ncbi:MAG: enoyl-CoA hydratase-related protein [Chloroflexi bacterium]|nr:enoyl-CoA hydratase-related protein [Chloroflexota bacterium]MDA1145787.1 enoyl-CoA hydratase-related protein [Chloroflexota bacterium]